MAECVSDSASTASECSESSIESDTGTENEAQYPVPEKQTRK